MTRHVCHRSLTEVTRETSRRAVGRAAPEDSNGHGMRRDPTAPTWHPKAGDGPHASPSLPQQHEQEEQPAGQTLPLPTAGQWQLPPSSPSSPPPSESPTSPTQPLSSLQNAGDPSAPTSTYRGERPAHPTPPLAAEPPAPFNTRFQDRGRKRRFPQGLLRNGWEWMAGNLEGL